MFACIQHFGHFHLNPFGIKCIAWLLLIFAGFMIVTANRIMLLDFYPVDGFIKAVRKVVG